MLKMISRVAVAVTFTAGMVFALPATAHANGSGCSAYKSVPNISVSYSNCFSNWSIPNEWQSYTYLKNNHGAGVSMQSQVDLIIDGDDHFLSIKSWNFGTGLQDFDPYNGTYSGSTRNSCTGTHTYQSLVRMRITGGSWGAWASAPSFYC